MSTRIAAMFEIRMPATLQPFRRARPGRQAAVVSAAGVPLAPHAPDGRCHTFRSPPGFRSATRCFRCFHSSLTLDGPHDTRTRHAPEIEPSEHSIRSWTLNGCSCSMGLPYDGSGVSNLLLPWGRRIAWGPGLHGVCFPWVRPQCERTAGKRTQPTVETAGNI